MTTTRTRRAAVTLAAAAVLPLALSACSSSDSKDSGKSDSSAAASSPMASQSMGAGSMDQPFGPACSSVPKNGAGSFDGMSKDPVATAASNNPALSTLVAAVKKAGVVCGNVKTSNANVYIIDTVLMPKS
nr:hypothetical protein [Streptomyces seoulensis]